MNTNRIKILGLLGLPLLAIAIAVMVFAFGPTTKTTDAANGPDGTAMHMEINGNTGKVSIGENSQFTVVVVADEVPSIGGALGNGNGYKGVQAWIDYGATGLSGKGNQQVLWADCFVGAIGVGAIGTSENMGCLDGTAGQNPQFASLIKAPVDMFSFELGCDKSGTNGTHTILLLALGDPLASTSGTGFSEFDSTNQFASTNTPAGNGDLVADSIEVNCIPATSTATSTPTATPPPVPRMQKCDPATKTRDVDTDITNNCVSLVNQFLQRQGDSKIAPATCKDGAGTTLIENLSQPIVTLSPKGEPQTLAAFEFEVHYDSKKVCVTITPGSEFQDPTSGLPANSAICVVEDQNTKPQLEGVARIGCVTVGKGHNVDELAAIASITIYPQPEIYSDMKPNQDNGQVVQINNVNCDLGDEQGHAIAVFSCDDADITFRFLEGDVYPDCIVDTIDAQAIAFRWGVTKGSLIYRDFMNLEPSNQQADNDIDINDLQFVFGRFGSSCADPHPAQPPVNPKADTVADEDLP